MDINSNRLSENSLVSIAPGKYLFPFRTQKSSPVAAIILPCGKVARCQIIEELSLSGSFSLFMHTAILLHECSHNRLLLKRVVRHSV